MKKLLIVALIISLLVSVSACSGGKKAETGDKKGAAEEITAVQTGDEGDSVSDADERSTEDTKKICKLPSRVTKVHKDVDGQEYEETITFDFNSSGDIIESSRLSGKAETRYWEGSGKKKEVVWTGRGYGSKDTLTYDEKGHLLKSVHDAGDLGYVTSEEYEYSNGWISKETYHYVGGSTEREYDLTFHDNGMVESAGNTFFNEKGLPEKVETGGQYPGTYTFEYEYDDDENVISALVDFTDIHGEYSTQTRLVFEYEPSIMVSRRTQSAWICFCLNVYCEAREVYKDILGIG